VTSERQRAALAAAAAAGRAAALAADAGRPVEIVALELRAAADALASVLGERIEDDVLDALFARFCLGK
jgi:tRNA modification GTPase